MVCGRRTKGNSKLRRQHITNEPLDLGESGYIPFDEDTEPNFTGEELTIGEFMNSKFEQEQGMGGM